LPDVLALQIFAALLLAGFVQVFLMGSGFVSPHNGAPGVLTFVVVMVVLRLSTRAPTPPSANERNASDPPNAGDA
jgi:hypothetical protein